MLQKRTHNNASATSTTKPLDATKKSGPYICRYEEIPLDHFFLRATPATIYIRRGYRINHKTVSDVFKSFWTWHNETMNVHTHFWTAVLFVLLMVRTFFFVPVFQRHAEPTDYIVYTISAGSALFCFGCSTCYHLFNCKSEIAYKISEKVDFGGILVFLCCGLIGCFYYGFWCLSEFRSFYSWLAVALSIVIFPIVLISKNRTTRTNCFLSIVALGFFACFRWIYIVGISAPDVRTLMPYVMVMWAFMGIAFFFYLSKLPERYFPGRVDFIGASHQLWHIFISLGAVWQYHFFMTIFEYRKTIPCESL